MGFARPHRQALQHHASEGANAEANRKWKLPVVLLLAVPGLLNVGPMGKRPNEIALCSYVGSVQGFYFYECIGDV